MIAVETLINALRNKIVADNWIADVGLVKNNLVLGYAPNTDNTPPKTGPRVTFSFEATGHDQQLNVTIGLLHIVASFKERARADVCHQRIVNSLDRYTISNADLNIYACWFSGGPPVATYDDELDVWEAMVSFHIRVGGG